MKHVVVILSLATLGFQLSADQIRVNSYGTYQAGSGGEFTLNTKVGGVDGGLGWIIDNYADGKTANKSLGTFQTFCIEANEHIYQNTTYDGVLNDYAIFGGTDSDTSSPNGGDYISKGTAWLYYQFAKGLLSGYRYSGTETQREADAKALQNAIWNLEDEGGNLSGLLGANTLQQILIDKFGSITDAKKNNYSNGQLTYPVQVLNLWSPVGHIGEINYQKQDQLILVPDGGLTLSMLGLGILGLTITRRRIAN